MPGSYTLVSYLILSQKSECVTVSYLNDKKKIAGVLDSNYDLYSGTSWDLSTMISKITFIVDPLDFREYLCNMNKKPKKEKKNHID